MGSYARPFFEIDQAVVCVGQATTQIAAQEERISLDGQKGDDMRNRNGCSAS